MGLVAGMLIAWALQAPVESGGAAASNESGICSKKRVDACGCHHVYGMRHCHMNRRSEHCEAPANARLPVFTPVKTPVRF